MFAFANAFVLLLLSGAAFFLSRFATIRRGEAVSPAVGWGSGMFIASLLLLCSLFTLDNVGVALAPLSLLLLVLCVYQCSSLRTAPTNSDRVRPAMEPQRNLKIAGLTVGVIYGVVIGMILILFCANGLLGTRSTNAWRIEFCFSDASSFQRLVASAIAASLIALILPALILLILTVLSRIARLPASVGVVRGYRRIAPALRWPVAPTLLRRYRRCGTKRCDSAPGLATLPPK